MVEDPLGYWYLCMYVYMVCMFVCTYLRMYVCMYVCMYECMCVLNTLISFPKVFAFGKESNWSNPTVFGVPRVR